MNAQLLYIETCIPDNDANVITNVTSNKYIIIFQRICVIYDNNYSYNKF